MKYVEEHAGGNPHKTDLTIVSRMGHQNHQQVKKKTR